MKRIDWRYDGTTAYWANQILLPITLPVQPQYNGLDYRLRKETWKKHILSPDFPEYCHYPNQPESLLCSPENIIRCFQDHLVLEALVLVVAWGRMTRSKIKIYQKPRQIIDKTLLECLHSTGEKDSVEDAWKLLVKRLGWGDVITSKCLHFLARSLGYGTNSPVPIDNKVIHREVWPTFKKLVSKHRSSSDCTMPYAWGDNSTSWAGYNRYMTAINCWADAKGWTTTQVESTIFQEYYPYG